METARHAVGVTGLDRGGKVSGGWGAAYDDPALPPQKRQIAAIRCLHRGGSDAQDVGFEQMHL